MKPEHKIQVNHCLIKKITSFYTSNLFGFIVALLCALLIGTPNIWGQKKQTSKSQNTITTTADSARREQIRIMDSTRSANKRILDSTISARRRVADSMKAERERRTDSIEALRKYRESKRYRDSVERVRTARLDSIKQERQRVLDSTNQVRNRTRDSLNAIRQATTDSIKAIQKQRSDSLAASRKYRESKRYRDSVELIRSNRLDSIKQSRQRINDSIAAERQRVLDSTKAERQRVTDSIASFRKQMADSLDKVRKARADSLEVVKAKRLRDAETRKKVQEEKLQLRMELKVQKKREKWSNELMLKKRWTFLRAFIQNTVTRYNYYFNANRKMNEAIANMYRRHEDNYEEYLQLFPFNPATDTSKWASDMDSIIAKASLGTQIHDPRTKWADDLFLLYGQAQYYKGDYQKALDAFKYVVHFKQQQELLKNKKKKKSRTSTIARKSATKILEAERKGLAKLFGHRSAHNDAILWMSRTYVDAKSPQQAEGIIDLIDLDTNSQKQIKGKVALEKAYKYISENQHYTAAEQLLIVANDKHIPKRLKERSAYLAGQIYQENRAFEKAMLAFEKVIDFKPALMLDFYSRRNLAQNAIAAGKFGKQDEQRLVKLTKDNKYIDFHDQLLGLLAQAALHNNDTLKGLDYLAKAVQQPKARNVNKAIAYGQMGDIYYNQARYMDAKNAYDSMLVFQAEVTNPSLIAQSLLNSALLDKMIQPALKIQNNDSLIDLSKKSDREKLDVVRAYIRQLEKRYDDSVYKAENAAIAVPVSAPAGVSVGTVTWYFANPNLVQKGVNDFKSKWGNRPLIDNWRRKSALQFVVKTNTNGNLNDTEDDAETDERGIPTEAFLLSKIPVGEEQIKALTDETEKAHLELATIYIDEFGEFGKGEQVINDLEKRNPNHPYQVEMAYLKYLVALEYKQQTKIDQWRQYILDNYPTSRYAQLLAGDTGGVDLNEIDVTGYYEKTYEMVQEGLYLETLDRVKMVKNNAHFAKYIKRLTLIEAMAFAGLSDWPVADSLVNEAKNADRSNELNAWITHIESYIKNAREQDSIRLENARLDSLKQKAVQDVESIEVANDGGIMEAFTPDKTAPHFVLFRLGGIDNRLMGLKAGLGDYIRLKASDQNLSVDVLSISLESTLLVIKSFKNFETAKLFVTDMLKERNLLSEYKPGEYKVWYINEQNFNLLKKQRNLSDYDFFQKANYR